MDSVRVDIDVTNEFPIILNDELLVFPNPTANNLQLQFEMLDKLNVSIQLFDMQGREVAIIHEGILLPGKV